MNKNSTAEGYNYARQSLASILGAIEGQEYVNSVTDSIEKMSARINSYQGNNAGIGQLKGNIFEELHHGTYKIDATVKSNTIGSMAQELPKSTDFASVDVYDNDGTGYSLKNFKTGTASAKAQAESFGEAAHKNTAKSGKSVEEYLHEKGVDPSDADKSMYNGQKRVVPKDQLPESQDYLTKKALKEAEARPEQVERYQDTRDNLTDKMESSDGTKSTPIDEKTTREITEEAKQGKFDPAKYGISPDELIKYQYIIKESYKAGMQAAAISMALKLAPEIIKAIQNQINNGEISSEDLKRMGIAAIEGAGGGFVKGSIAAALRVSTLVGVFGETLRNVDTNVISGATVIGTNAIINAFNLARGQINLSEFEDKTVQDLCAVPVGMFFGTITQAVIPVPVLGYMIGNMVGSTLAITLYSENKYNAFDRAIENFNTANQSLDKIMALLCDLDIERFRKEMVSIRAVSLALETDNLQHIYYDLIERGISLQFKSSEEFRIFMSDNETKLII